MSYREIIFLCIMLCSTIFSLIVGIKRFLKKLDEFYLIIGIICLIILLEFLFYINHSYFEPLFIHIVIWGSGVIFLILFVISKKKFCLNVKKIIDLLNNSENSEKYKEISNKLFTGFINFEYSMPPKNSSEEKTIYEEGIQEFCELDFSNENENLVKYQKLVRRNIIYEYFLIGMVIAFALQGIVINF